MLPWIFPAFPERSEFDIYATMTPAKEVGGDFYDFFLVDPDHLAIVIADVSGKGVPAALFMVITKTLIKNHVQMGESPGQAFTAVNQTLCENNEAGLFVTAWMGILTISTGELVCIPMRAQSSLLGRAEGSFDISRCAAALSWRNEDYIQGGASEAGKPGYPVSVYGRQADGATISMRRCMERKRQTYSAIRRRTGKHPRIKQAGSVCRSAPQFDDITMLILRDEADSNFS